jgi:hypothetical protein
MLKYREEYMEISEGGLDVLFSASTIASACMQIFKLKYMKPSTIAIVPQNCYNTFNDNQSDIALKWMKYLTETRNITIQTAESPKGEFVVPNTNYKLDGFIEGNPPIGIEVHGCAWHACRKCFTDPLLMLPNGKTVQKTREEHEKRMEILKKHMHIEEYWECEIRQLYANSRNIKMKIDDYVITTPALRIREGFCGGRTAPVRTYFKAEDGWIIKYRDYTSLYPYTQTTEYPIKHPKFITVPIEERNVHWTR